jgi:hypothetical protein
VASLSTGECGSYLHGAQKPEVDLYPTGFECEVVKVARVDHPGKANIITDMLSRKAHCNYLPAVRLTGEESSTRVLPNVSLFNITLTPSLRDEIMLLRRMTMAWIILREE